MDKPYYASLSLTKPRGFCQRGSFVSEAGPFAEA